MDWEAALSNKKIITTIINGLTLPYSVSIQDLYQEGYLALAKVFPKLDDKFNEHQRAAYLFITVRNALVKYIKKYTQAVTAPLKTPTDNYFYTDTIDLEIMESDSIAEELLVEEETISNLAEVIEEAVAYRIKQRDKKRLNLNSMERFAVKYLYPHLTAKEIAAKYNVKRSGIYKILRSK